MTAQDAFKRFVADELRGTFMARGFRARGFTFHRRVADNFGIVQLQKSQYSTATNVDFTINLGVFSGRVQQTLSNIMWMPEVRDVPTEPACHLRQRVGFLLPERRDTWWSVREDEDTAELGAAIRLVLEQHAFPFLQARMSDEGLRDHWLQEARRGRDGLALAVLVRDLGPEHMLASLLERLRAVTPSTATALIEAIDKFSATP
jgi:hypothetical protein